MTERRFSEKEIAEILTRATRPVGGDRALPARRKGLTIDELMDVGEEVGIDPARIRSAARELGRAPETILGLPHVVSHAIPLPRPLDDEGWERLVAHLRATFSGKGETSSEGSLRSWTHEDVEVHLEPDPLSDDWRIRAVARNKDDVEALGVGLLALLGPVLAVLPTVTGATSGLFWVGLILFLVGVGAAGWSAWALPRWAEKRGHELRTLDALRIEGESDGAGPGSVAEP